MSYFGKPVDSSLTALPADAAANIGRVQTDIELKLDKNGGVLTNATTSVSPVLANNSLAVAPTKYVDQSIAASGAVLMALKNGII